MALRKSTQVAVRAQAPAALDASNPITAYAEFTAATGQFAAADVLELIPFPAHTKLIYLAAHIEDLDSATGLTLDFGVLSGQYLNALDDAGSARTCGTEFGDNLTTGQAGGSVLGTAAQMLAIAPSQLDRSIGFKIEAAPTTLIPGAKIRVCAMFAPVPVGVTVS